jgi:hypothetical protein
MRGEIDSMLSRRQERLRTPDRIRFVPAWWLLAALALLRVWLSGGTFGKLGAAGLVWSLAPRKLKLVAGGFAGVALLVTAGAVAALALLAMQLT